MVCGGGRQMNSGSERKIMPENQGRPFRLMMNVIQILAEKVP